MHHPELPWKRRAATRAWGREAERAATRARGREAESQAATAAAVTAVVDAVSDIHQVEISAWPLPDGEASPLERANPQRYNKWYIPWLEELDEKRKKKVLCQIAWSSLSILKKRPGEGHRSAELRESDIINLSVKAWFPLWELPLVGSQNDLEYPIYFNPQTNCIFITRMSTLSSVRSNSDEFRFSWKKNSILQFRTIPPWTDSQWVVHQLCLLSRHEERSDNLECIIVDNWVYRCDHSFFGQSYGHSIDIYWDEVTGFLERTKVDINYAADTLSGITSIVYRDSSPLPKAKEFYMFSLEDVFVKHSSDWIEPNSAYEYCVKPNRVDALWKSLSETLRMIPLHVDRKAYINGLIESMLTDADIVQFESPNSWDSPESQAIMDKIRQRFELALRKIDEIQKTTSQWQNTQRLREELAQLFLQCFPSLKT